MKKVFAFIAISLLFSSCYDDHSEVIPGQDFIPEEILAEIRENGQPIFEGLNPPDVTGRYRISPAELVSSNFDDDLNPGHRFADEYIEFSEFDEASLTLRVDIEQSGSIGEGYGSFISGSGDSFTIYVRIDNINEQDVETLQTRVYSGSTRDNGVIELYGSTFMIDDGGDPFNNLIEIGQGRLFKDGDGFSEKIP